MADVNRGSRPLSPHLTVYRPQLTSMTSIFVRLTGNALLIAALMIVWWFVAAAAGPDAFATALATSINEPRTSMLTLKTEPDLDIVIPSEPFDPVVIKRRFEDAIGVKRYVPEMFKT